MNFLAWILNLSFVIVAGPQGGKKSQKFGLNMSLSFEALSCLGCSSLIRPPRTMTVIVSHDSEEGEHSAFVF